ncbi:MAG: hypothetical protein HFF54_01505 [Lawsonibacter sp.]|nr:hypothetical protein [Lawsonibacter sp.]
MAGFEEQLNSILGNQEAMSQIMALARSLSGESPKDPTPPPEALPEGGGTYPPAEPQPPDLSALLGQVDPKMIQTGMEILRQVQSTEDRGAVLLDALRPYLREDRRPKLDRALQIARMVKLVRAAMGAFGGEEGDRV